MSNIQFDCPNCRKRLEAPGDMALEPTICPRCKIHITVPDPAAPPVIPVAAAPSPPEYSSLAIASLVIGVVAVSGGWIWTGVLLPALTVILAHIALYRIKKRGPALKGKNLAVVALILGYVSLLVTIVTIIACQAAIKEVEAEAAKFELEMKAEQRKADDALRSLTESFRPRPSPPAPRPTRRSPP